MHNIGVKPYPIKYVRNIEQIGVPRKTRKTIKEPKAGLNILFMQSLACRLK